LMFWPDSGGFDRQLATFGQGLSTVAEAGMDGKSLQEALQAIDVVIAEFAASGSNHSAGIAESSEVWKPGARPATQKNGAVGFNIWLEGKTWVAGSQNVPKRRAQKIDLSGFYYLVLDKTRYRVYSTWTADRRMKIDVLQPYEGQWTDFNDVMLSPVSIVTPLLVGFPLLLLPVLIVMKCGLKPLRELATKLASRRPDDLQPVHVNDLLVELEPVVNEVNGTLGRLDALLKRERDFLADAAHELRTPLAVISAQVDGVLQAATPAAREEAERGLQAGLGRANRLVSQLLTLARFEANADKGEPADVADVVRDVLASYAWEARAKSIQLAYRGPDQVPVGCAQHTLGSALGNLVGNAIRYGREGGQVVVGIRLEASQAFVLSVCDDGPGLNPEERARMFDRFWRGSQSSASGSGLGLAIVAAAVRQHNARIHVEDGIGGQGLCVVVNVPGPDGVYAAED
jgi:two-component system, OmpR family, sensor histidine kinase QseC